MWPFLVIIHDFDFLGSGLGPPEHDPPLVVNSDRVFAGEASLQSFKLVSRRYCQVGQNDSVIQLDQFSTRHLRASLRKTLWDLSFRKDRLREFSVEAPDHAQ